MDTPLFSQIDHVTSIDDEDGMTVSFVDLNGAAHTTKLPWKWAICGTCDGHGKHSHSVDGHGITQDERDRDWDEESWATYMSGGYDKTCESCSGGKVREANLEHLPKNMLDAMEEYWKEESDYRAICKSERDFGC